MLDIHSHILPSVDDGAEDMQEAIEMARIYLENGIEKVIATPHYIEGAENSNRKQNKAILEQLREALDKEGLDLDVYLGNEVYISMELVDYLEKKQASSLNNSRYLLLELPMFDIPLYTEDIIYKLQLEGYVPIIAHPERNSKIVEDPNILYELIRQGALAQLNLPSIEGRYGSRIEETARILLEHNMIHFLGSDAHSKGRRSPYVKEGLNTIRDIVDDETYDKIRYLNGLKIIDDEEILVEPPREYIKKTKTMGSIRGKLTRLIGGLRRQ